MTMSCSIPDIYIQAWSDLSVRMQCSVLTAHPELGADSLFGLHILPARLGCPSMMQRGQHVLS